MKKKITIKPIILVTIILSIILLVSFLLNSIHGNQPNIYANSNVENYSVYFSSEEKSTQNTQLNFDIESHYKTNVGNGYNIYYIDDNNILWGCGDNQKGQLGLGYSDEENHSYEKIAENVIHIDCSLIENFMLYITSNGDLFVCGTNSTNASSPSKLAENVKYASCGRYDIAYIDSNNNLLTYDIISENDNYQAKNSIILTNCIYVTGGASNHAALRNDNSVWTWGYNYAGNCAIADADIISVPTKVAENVFDVWTGSDKLNIDCYSLEEYNNIDHRFMDNTIIQYENGDKYICGAYVGNTVKNLPVYFEAIDYELICSSKFMPYPDSYNNVEIY